MIKAIVLALAVPVLALVVVGVVNDAGELSMDECFELQTVDHRELETVAAEVMGDVASETYRSGMCESSGEPDAYVGVQVFSWTSREQARDYLEGRGMKFKGRSATTPDGRVMIGITTTLDHVHSDTRFVDVSFWLAT